MTKTLKTIRIVFQLDPQKIERNINAVGATIDAANKTVEEANKQVVASNEKVAQSSEEVAQAAQKESKAIKALTGGLGVLGDLAQIASTGIQSLGIGLTGAALLAIKFHRQVELVGAGMTKAAAGISTVRGHLVRFGRQLALATLNGSKFALMLGKNMVQAEILFLQWIQKLNIQNPLLQRGILASADAVIFLSKSVRTTALALSDMVMAVPGVTKVVERSGKAFVAASGSVGAFLNSLRKGNEQFPRFNKFLDKMLLALSPLVKQLTKVGTALIPVVARILSLGAILPGIGALVIWFAAKALWKLAKSLWQTGQNALEMAKKFTQTADALAKTASKLGVHVETLQQYQHAASLAGVKQEQLNVGLQRFLRRTAEARQGTGVLKKEFDGLGISLVDSFGYVREGSEVFEEYLQKIAATRDKTEQLRLAFAAFDTEGVALVNLAKQGAEGFANHRKEAERLGIVLSAGLLRSYEEINDQLATNQKRIEAARLKNSLFLGEMAVKWDNLKTKIKVASLELLAFTRPLETRTVDQLERKLTETEKAIGRTKDAMNSAIANLPGVVGILEVFHGGLIEDQERILEAIRIAKGEQVKVEGERPFEVNQRIEEELALQERRLEQQKRLTEAAKQGEEARIRAMNLIEAENAAAALGIQATEEERHAIQELTLARLESEQSMQQLLVANKDLAAGEEIRLSTLERMQGATQQTDEALIRSVQSLLLMTDAGKKTQREFEKLSQNLAKNTAALNEMEKELKQGAGATEQAKKKYALLSKQANQLRREIEKSRAGLQKMEEKLQDSAEASETASRAALMLGNSYANASAGVDQLTSALQQNEEQLASVGKAADDSADSVAGFGRVTRDLGPVVGGAGGAADIERAIAALEAQLRQVSKGADVWGFSEIQKRSLRAEIERLEEDLRIVNEETRREIVSGIIRSHSELSGAELQAAIQEEIKLQERYGLLPSAGSTRRGYQQM